MLLLNLFFSLFCFLGTDSLGACLHVVQRGAPIFGSLSHVVGYFPATAGKYTTTCYKLSQIGAPRRTTCELPLPMNSTPQKTTKKKTKHFYFLVIIAERSHYLTLNSSSRDQAVSCEVCYYCVVLFPTIFSFGSMSPFNVHRFPKSAFLLCKMASYWVAVSREHEPLADPQPKIQSRAQKCIPATHIDKNVKTAFAMNSNHPVSSKLWSYISFL